jgi:hypothetical protein
MKHVALYDCEMLPFTLREEHRLRVFEIRVQRIIFESKRELHNLYSSQNRRIIESGRMTLMGYVTYMKETKNGYKILTR